MRFLFMIMLTLLIFTTNQVAMAYELCEDPHCQMTTDKAEHKQEKKSDKPVHHCCGTHVLNQAPTIEPPLSLKTTSAVASAPQHFASIAPPTLTEPPTSL